MPTPIEAYRQGYEKGHSDSAGGRLAEITMGMLRDDPSGYFQAGYSDGAAGKSFSPPSIPVPKRIQTNGLIPKFSENPMGWFLGIFIMIELWVLWQLIKAPFQLIGALMRSEKPSPSVIVRNAIVAGLAIALVWWVPSVTPSPSPTVGRDTPTRFDPSAASVQDAQRDLTCQRFMAADNPWPDYQDWLRGIDLTTCKDASGRTPLMKSALARSAESVNYLFYMNADVKARDNAGETALSLVQKQLPQLWNDPVGRENAQQVINFLQNAMAAVPITAEPSTAVSLCNSPVSFVALKTQSKTRLNVSNNTGGILMISRLDQQARWGSDTRLEPHASSSIGVDYAEEIFRIADSGGTCLTIVRPGQVPYTGIIVGQRNDNQQ